MFKQYKKHLIIGSIVILLPILAGLLLWNTLPDRIPTHWGPSGQPDGWSSKGIAVFGLPLFLLAIHWVCLLVTASDIKNTNQTKKMIAPILWICPAISLFGNAFVYSNVLGYSMSVVKLPAVLLGLLFLYIGNYLPKCRHNYTIGIRLPWTLASEENWNATHRFAGKVWVVGSIGILALVFLPEKFVFPSMMIIFAVLVIVPTIYSWLYQKKHA